MAGRGLYPFSPAWNIAVLWGARQYLGVEEKAEDPGAQGLSRAWFRFHPALPMAAHGTPLVSLSQQFTGKGQCPV